MSTTGAIAAGGSTLDSDYNKKKKNTIKWGIIGLGDVTAIKSGPPFYKCVGSQLVAGYRRTPGAAAEWAKTIPSGDDETVGYDNLDDFLSHPGLDAVYIATPPDSHLSLAKKVAEKKLACYVEKPVGRCGFETQEIVNIFERNGLKLYTAYVGRAYERTEAIRQLLTEKVIGDKVTSVTYTLRGSGGARGLDAGGGRTIPWRLDAKRSGGGLVMDVGCHIVDRIMYLCGPMEGVTGEARNRNSPGQDVEDYVKLHATIGSSDWSPIDCRGATVDCTWDFSGLDVDEKGEVDELVLSGPKGSIRMVGMTTYLPVKVMDNEGNVVRELTFEPPEHAAMAMIQLINDDLRGILPPEKMVSRTLSRGDNAVWTSLALDAVLNSNYGGREDEFWLRPESWSRGGSKMPSLSQERPPPR